MPDWGISEEATKLHHDALVWDSLMPWLDYGSANLRVGALKRMAAAGYDFISLTIALDGTNVDETIRAIGRERAFFRENNDAFMLVDTVEDVLRAKAEGKLAVGFNFQGTEPIGRDLSLVEVYCRLGVRQMLMAYNQANAVGAGCHERVDGGLTRFGMELVAEMNRVGVFVDVSHTGYRTSMDVFDVSDRPVIFSHSNPLALEEHGRNIRDDQAKACARSGGVVGINGCGSFMAKHDTSTEGLLRVVDYYAELIGPQHVGIGLDYVYDEPSWRLIVDTPANRSRYPVDAGYKLEQVTFAEPEQLPPLTEGLLKRGYVERDIRGILGENWARVAHEVWGTA